VWSPSFAVTAVIQTLQPLYSRTEQLLSRVLWVVAMGCGASRGVEMVEMEEEGVVVDHERLRKAREDQRLVVER
jgi:hypothetical protein